MLARMGVLAIDPGVNKSGFAFADRLRIVTRALDPTRSDGDDERLADHIQSLVEERDVSTLLVGLPLTMGGEETGQAERVRVLIALLHTRFPKLEIVAYDERLTTKEAESRLREHGYSGREIRTRKDSWAALVLLEDWLRSGEPR